MGHMNNLQNPRTDPRVIRATLNHADANGVPAASIATGVHHQNIYRWRKYREMFGPEWPTDADVAAWDAVQPQRLAHAVRKANYVKQRYLNRGGPVNPLVPVIGSARRVQSLVAIGWSMCEIGARAGLTHARISQIALMANPTVYEKTAKRIDKVYRELCATPCTRKFAHISRKRAVDRGWVSPLAWDDIDDPEEKPKGTGLTQVTWHGVDEAAVLRRMAGDRTVTMHRAESEEVVRRLAAQGHQMNWIGERTGLKPDRYKDAYHEGRAVFLRGQAA